MGKEGEEGKREWEKEEKNRYKKGSFFYVCVLCVYVYYSKRKWVYFFKWIERGNGKEGEMTLF